MFVKMAKLYTPEYIKNKNLQALFRLTADAFQSEAPGLEGLSFSERLEKYACFTKEQSEKRLIWEGAAEERKRRIETIEGKLYQGAFQLGKELRRSLHIKTWEQGLEALEFIYRIMGIDFRYGGRDPSQGGRAGGFSVKACYFSEYYSAEICAIISSLDAGLAAGLSGGGRLCFTQRITEGCSSCGGYFGKESIDS